MRILSLILATASAMLLYPEQVHISWTENEGEMRVTWVTFYPISSVVSYRPILCNSPALWTYLDGSFTEFDQGDTLEIIQYINTAVIKDLDPSCFYEYSVGNYVFWSEIFLFNGRTADYSEPFDTTEVNLIVLGDWGTGDLGKYTLNLLGEEAKLRDFDAVLHIGDIAYDLNDQEGEIGNIWLNMVEHIAGNYAYMTNPGNHESPNNFTHYSNRFKMPINEANQGTSWFYSFDYGPAHFVMIDTEVYFFNSAEVIENQLNWLKADLEKANKNRGIRPWLIVLGHRALYCSINNLVPVSQINPACGSQATLLKNKLEDLMYTNGVDVFFQAHLHNYERDAPVYKNLTVPSEFDGENIHIGAKAPIYITNGNAGNVEAHNPVSPTPQEWSRFLSNDYGYGRLSIFNNTHLYYEQFSSELLECIDYVWLIKTQNSYNS